MNDARRDGNSQVSLPNTLCADCSTEIGRDNGPKDGWQLEDGRTVCNSCCAADTKIQVKKLIQAGKKRVDSSEVL